MPKHSPIHDPSVSPSESDRKQRDLAENGASVESTPPKKRRRFTASEKLRLLKAAEAALASGEHRVCHHSVTTLHMRAGQESAPSTGLREYAVSRGSTGLEPYDALGDRGVGDVRVVLGHGVVGLVKGVLRALRCEVGLPPVPTNVPNLLSLFATSAGMHDDRACVGVI